MNSMNYIFKKIKYSNINIFVKKTDAFFEMFHKFFLVLFLVNLRDKYHYGDERIK